MKGNVQLLASSINHWLIQKDNILLNTHWILFVPPHIMLPNTDQHWPIDLLYTEAIKSISGTTAIGKNWDCKMLQSCL